jgi:CheY-like chemotaxis protein
MGGSIAVKCAPASGSIFYFTVSLPTIDTPLASNTCDTEPIECHNILVVDENEVNQIVVEELLKRDGHSVAIATNGVEAVEAARAGNFDLVLMDMQMPVMSGIDASREIRKLDATVCDVPIVALTANAMVDEIRRRRDAGMNGHLAKPIDRGLLRDAISVWTGTLPAGESVGHGANLSEALPAVAHTATEEPRAPITAWSDTPALGIETLLKLFDGDESSVLALLDAASKSIESDLRKLEKSMIAMDMEEVAQSAHRLKGSSGSIGAMRLLAASSAAEAAARAQPCDIGTPLLIALREAVDELNGFIKVKNYNKPFLNTPT